MRRGRARPRGRPAATTRARWRPARVASRGPPGTAASLAPLLAAGLEHDGGHHGGQLRARPGRPTRPRAGTRRRAGRSRRRAGAATARRAGHAHVRRPRSGAKVPGRVSTSHTRSKTRAIELVRPSMRRTSASCSARAGGSARPTGRGPHVRSSRGTGGCAAGAAGSRAWRRRWRRLPASGAARARSRARAGRPARCAWPRPGPRRGAGVAREKLLRAPAPASRYARRPPGRAAESVRTCRSPVSTVGPGPSSPSRPGVEHHRVPGAPAAGDLHDVATRGRRQAGQRLGPARREPPRGAGPAPGRPGAGAGSAYSREVAQVAAHRLGVALQRLGVRLRLPRQPDDGPVRLELREARLEHLAGPVRPTCATRLTAMLYVGRKLDRSG